MRVLHMPPLIATVSVAAILGISAYPAGFAVAQQQPAPPAPAQAASDSPQTMRDRGLALIYGLDGAAADVPAGAELLGQAAAKGDVKAQAELGRMLVDGYYLKADPARGLALLEAAAKAGDARAMTALGGALLWGKAAPADPARAKALLAKAAAAGDGEARALLGEQLVGGWILPRDVAAGKALLEAGVTAGDARAQTALSGLYLYGIGLPKDAAKARDLAEAAAAQGKPKALRQVGEMLMWSQRDAAGAEALLRRAGEMGDGEAWAVLAEGAMYGYLGGGSASRAKFAGFAERARAAGNERIEVLDATRQMWGISMIASGPKTIERLQTAADAGNGTAARFLVGLLRDGNRMNVHRHLDNADAALAKYGATIGPDDSWRLGETIAAARARAPAAWAKLATQVASRPELATKDFGRDLYKANPNATIYLLQKKLAGEGLYRGALDGIAGRQTLKALYRACSRLPDDPPCNDSVMRPDVLGAVFAAR